MQTVSITLISDFICPWCYIGKARLERLKDALASEIVVHISIRPYLLYPNIPKGGVSKSTFANKTKPGMGKALRSEAKIEGVTLNYNFINIIPNTLEAHRLVYLAENDPFQFVLSKKIFQGYFEDGKNIEDKDLLISYAQEIGISEQIVHQFQKTNDGFMEVKQDIQLAKEEMISLVPSLYLDQMIIIPGLQSYEVLEKYVRRAALLSSEDKCG